MSAEQPQRTSPAPDTRLLSLRCPNSYYSYPKLLNIAPIPDGAFPTLDSVWKRAIHPGRDVDAYRLRDVFVVKEGLVFDADARLFDLSQTYHNADEVAEGHAAVLRAREAGSAPSLGKGILAKSRGAGNYGHFILEMLPRAWIARSALGLSDWPAVIDSHSPILENVSRQALEAAGFAPDQVIATDQAPVHFDEIVLVDGLTLHSQYMSPFVMQCLDAIAAGVPEGPARAIYAPRRPVMARDFENEAAVAGQLAKIGFTEVRTAECSFREQIAAFKGASTVVAVSGAALTNIAFCRPGTRVYSFTPCSALEVLFWMIAEARRLDYREIRCPEVGPPTGGLPWDRAIRMTPRDVERIVKAP